MQLTLSPLWPSPATPQRDVIHLATRDETQCLCPLNAGDLPEEVASVGDDGSLADIAEKRPLLVIFRSSEGRSWHRACRPIPAGS